MARAEEPLTAARPTLLERVARGDSEAVAAVLDEYGPLVWSLARRQLGAEAAEDVVQESFVQIWKNAHRYDRARASEATYIATIVRRRIIDHRRKLGRGLETEELPVDVPIESPLGQLGLEAVDLADEARVAAEALAELRPAQQKVLHLAIVQGLSHVQIAEVTRMPLGTVKSHARRGLERVRELLRERSGGGPG